MKEKINKKMYPLVRGSNRYKIIFLKRKILPCAIIIGIIWAISTIIFYCINGRKINSNIFKEIELKEISYSFLGKDDSLRNSVENGYISSREVQTIYSNDIGCKIEKFIISDTDIYLLISYFYKNNPIKVNGLKSNIVIYNENKEGICEYFPNDNMKYQSDILKKYNVNSTNYTLNQIMYNTIHQTENENTSQLFILSGETPFPRSSKLYVNIKDIGGFNKFNQYVTLYDNVEWNFELDVPEKFINRTNEEYKLSEEIEDVTMNKIEITDTRAIINYTTEKDNIKFRIIDENGKTYNSVYSKKIGDKEFNNYYNLNKNMLTEKMYLEVSYRDSIKKIELIK